MSPLISREEVFAVVKRHLMETIDGLSEEAIDKAESLADVGAQSIDVVEVVSCSMRELKIKVPRFELVLVESLSELVDLLHKYAVAGTTSMSCSPPSQDKGS